MANPSSRTEPREKRSRQRYIVALSEKQPMSSRDCVDYDVTDTRASELARDRVVGVWYYPRRERAACTECSGPLSAMLSSCPHAQAVRRFVKAQVKGRG